MNMIKLEIRNDGVAVLWIDVPDRSMNVLSLELCAELDAATARLKTDPAIRGLVIASAKNAFVAGFDLRELLQLAARNPSLKEAAALSAAISLSFRRLETCGKPVAAALHGAALGVTSSRSPATGASWPTTRSPSSGCRKCASACCLVPAERSACRG